MSNEVDAHKEKSVVVDETGQHWEAIIDSLLSGYSHIIALRGAGSFNGISVRDADRIVREQLILRVQQYLDTDGKVAILYDGDDDDPSYPDVGHIMGRLRDHFSHQVDFYAVQKMGWYRYADDLPKMRPLHSASGNEYQTILFPDNVFPGEHSHFTQNERLAASPIYEQWYVGACGQIADEQLGDFNAKAKSRAVVHRVYIFLSPVSTEQERKIQADLAEALQACLDAEDNAAHEELRRLRAKIQRYRDSIIRRAAHPFGLLCDKDGQFIMKPNYSNLDIEVVRLS